MNANKTETEHELELLHGLLHGNKKSEKRDFNDLSRKCIYIIEREFFHRLVINCSDRKTAERLCFEQNNNGWWRERILHENDVWLLFLNRTFIVNLFRIAAAVVVVYIHDQSLLK